MDEKRILVVGAGMRARDYVRALCTDFAGRAKLVGLCDPSQTRMDYMNRTLAGEWGAAPVPVGVPMQFEGMVKQLRVTTVVVTSVDATHHEYIVKALALGCDVITEKPITTTAASCRDILAAAQASRGRVKVAFNYRWQPHRMEVRRLLAAGTIGPVRSANLEYVLDTDHGADYFRRWHARMANSGGLLVHKATHHFDLINWWLDVIPESVVADGNLAFYGKENAIRRGEEALTAYARYTGQAGPDDPFRFMLDDAGMMEEMYLRAEAETGYIRDQNVFRGDIDIYDQMTALVRYRTGELLTYSLVGFSSREGMRVTFNGDRGRLEYYEFLAAPVIGRREAAEYTRFERPEHFIRVWPHHAADYEVPVQPLPGSHIGADPLMMGALFGGDPQADPLGRTAGAEQGIASVSVGIAGNESIRSRLPQRISDVAPLAPSARRLSELVRA